MSERSKNALTFNLASIWHNKQTADEAEAEDVMKNSVNSKNILYWNMATLLSRNSMGLNYELTYLQPT